MFSQNPRTHKPTFKNIAKVSLTKNSLAKVLAILVGGNWRFIVGVNCKLSYTGQETINVC
jgi:hypothetical protein